PPSDGVANPGREREELERWLGYVRVSVLRDDQNLRHRYLLSDVLSGSQKVDQCRCTVVFLYHAARFLGWTWDRLDHLAPGGVQADGCRGDPKIGQRPRLNWLLLGGKNSLHRRVSCLTRLIGDADNGRQVRFYGEGRYVVVAANADPIIGQGKRCTQGYRGPAKALGDHGGNHTHGAVGRSHAADHQVGRGLLDRLRQDRARSQRIRTMDRLVAEMDTGRCAHLQRTLDGISRIFGSQRHDNNFDVVAFVGELQCLLHRVLVEL